MDRLSKLLGHARRNKELLKILQEKRVNLNEGRLCEFHFWAKDEAGATGLAAELQKNGFNVLAVRLTESGSGRWNVEAGLKCSIGSVVDETFSKNLIDVASKYEADYDGWGTSI